MSWHLEELEWAAIPWSPQNSTELCDNHLKHFVGFISFNLVWFSQSMSSCKEIITSVVSAFCKEKLIKKNNRHNTILKRKVGYQIGCRPLWDKVAASPFRLPPPSFWPSMSISNTILNSNSLLERNVLHLLWWRTSVPACTFNLLQWPLNTCAIQVLNTWAIPPTPSEMEYAHKFEEKA